MAPVVSKPLKKATVAVALVVGSMNIIEAKKRRIWVKQYLKLREKHSKMRIPIALEPTNFKNDLRMGEEEFECLLNLVAPYIKKEDTFLRRSVSARERLVVTLRFLATGNTYQNLKYTCLISQPLLSKIIPETCRAIYKCLKNYIKMPTTETEWKETAEQFAQKWNFSNCVGACDGKHIAIEKPHGSGSLFYNHKRFFSIVLFAVVNANYEFLYVHTGTNGSVADASILNCTRFYQKMINNDLKLPFPSALPHTEDVVPYVFLGDSAFALNENLMKPFPFHNITYDQRIFNYRLSRAKRVVENAFGILSSRFRVLRRSLNTDLDTTDAIVMACCALHNYLRKQGTNYISHNDVDQENTATGTFEQGNWRSTSLHSLQHKYNNQTNDEANLVRNKFTSYFVSEGRVEFQDIMINVVPTNDVEYK